jgi:hypothetical protein
VPDPAHHFASYLNMWIWIAVLSAALTGVQMYTRARRMHSGMSDEMIRMAVEQFLPRPMLAAGAWYLLTGLVCIALGGVRALSPWAMGIPFGAGQLLVAGILFFTAQEGGDES